MSNATITVDGIECAVDPQQNLLHACLSHGFDLPYFCWHPAMGSVGACRQCAVVQYQNAEDTRGRLTMACMTPAADGMRISIAAGAAFRASVIEWLMLNHPHDCPVCEEGGECHLQDMTVMTGHAVRRYRGRKRTFRNQYLGPFVSHEMNRCITCYRCVRFYRDYAGGTDLNAFGSRGRMYFGRTEDGVLESVFSGNLVEVCPTGVFTDKPLAGRYTRKWDLQGAPSVCQGCAVGCNTLPAERYGVLKRIHNRYHGDINRYFLCDLGRYGADFVNNDNRLRRAGIRVEPAVFETLAPEAAVEQLAALVRKGGVIGIGSPRASLESNFALRTLVGEENFAAGMTDREASLVKCLLDIQLAGRAHIPTLTEAEAADAVVVLGEDLTHTAPRVALAVRQSVRNRSLEMAGDAGIPAWQDVGVRGHAQHARNPLFVATLLPTALDDVALRTFRATPANIARLGQAIARAIDAGDAHSNTAADDAPGSLQALAGEIATALCNAQRPLVVCGTGAGDERVLNAAASIAWALARRAREARQERNVSLLLCPPEVNSVGLGMLQPAGLSLQEALNKLLDGTATSLVVMENDLYRRAPQADLDKALDAADVVVLDVVEQRTMDRAVLVLPSATFAESTGTCVNYETRAQRYYTVFEPALPVQPSWRWLSAAAEAAGRNDMSWRHVDEVTAACARTVPALARIQEAAPASSYRAAAGLRVPRQPHRYSGRTAMYADKSVHEPQALADDETPLSFSMEGSSGPYDNALLTQVWHPGWNSNQSVTRFQEEVGGALKGGNPGIRLADAQRGKSTTRLAPEVPTAADMDADSYADSGSDSDSDSYSEEGGLTLFAVRHLFTSDELFSQSPAVIERASPPHVVLHPDDAATLGVAPGDGLRCAELDMSFEVQLEPQLPRGAGALLNPRQAVYGALPNQPLTLERDADFVRRPTAHNVIARG